MTREPTPLPPGILVAILERPGDDGPRLIAADALEEAGNLERSEFIRVQVELARIGKPPMNLETYAGAHLGGGHFKIGMNYDLPPEVGSRVDLRVRHAKRDDRTIHGMLVKQVTTHPTGYNERGEFVDQHEVYLVKDEKTRARFPTKQYERLQVRERALLCHNFDAWNTLPADPHGLVWDMMNFDDGDPEPEAQQRALFSRGFISSVSLSAADWLRHADAITASQPVEKVRLTPMPEWHYIDSDTLALWEDHWPRIAFTLPEPALERTAPRGDQ